MPKAVAARFAGVHVPGPAPSPWSRRTPGTPLLPLQPQPRSPETAPRTSAAAIPRTCAAASAAPRPTSRPDPPPAPPSPAANGRSPDGAAASAAARPPTSPCAAPSTPASRPPAPASSPATATTEHPNPRPSWIFRNGWSRASATAREPFEADVAVDREPPAQDPAGRQPRHPLERLVHLGQQPDVRRPADRLERSAAVPPPPVLHRAGLRLPPDQPRDPRRRESAGLADVRPRAAPVGAAEKVVVESRQCAAQERA